MLKRKKHIAYILFAIIFCANGAIAGTNEVQFLSNKSEYLCGEPILLKTIVTNLHGKNFAGELDYGKYHGNYFFGGCFTMYIALGEEDFKDILGGVTGLPSFPVTKPPLHLEYWTDRHCLPGKLELGQQSERVDMLILSRPGNYKLKAVFNNRDGSIRISSEPIQFQVIPIDQKKGDISKLGKQDLFVRLGRAIHMAYYEETDEVLTRDEAVKQIASMIVENYPDSAFSEYITYSHIFAYSPRYTEPSELAKGRKELAKRFIQDHTTSWLLPDIYRKLFWTYIAEKDREKAGQIRDKALQKSPHAAVLRFVKTVGATKLNQLNQKSPAKGQRLSLWTRPSFLIAMAVVVGIFAAGLILVIRKKARGRGK